MDRNEAVLRELNLYPLWVRRDAPVAEVVQEAKQMPETAVAPMQTAVEVREPEPCGEESPVPAAAGDSGSAGLDWPQLKTMVRDCIRCKLRANCTQTVFGVGDENAEWLFVGEGPGADEDALGEPFVGQAGKLLDNMLLAIGLKRGDNAYITNIVKCRPPNNRNPEADEIAACLSYLQRQIALIQPKLIVALGKVAANTLLGRDVPIGSLRGAVHDYGGTPLVVTYHPAYLLRSPSEKAKAWQDLKLAVATHAKTGFS